MRAQLTKTRWPYSLSKSEWIIGQVTDLCVLFIPSRHRHIMDEWGDLWTDQSN